MRYILTTFAIVLVVRCSAQQADSVQTHLNTIKVNLISSAIFRNSLVGSYERVLKPRQSLGVMVGVVRFPTIADFGSLIHVVDDNKQTGFVVGAEYRFYLKKENKYLAPRGVYVGPYATYYGFKNDRALTYTSPDTQATTDALLTMDIKVLNIGAQLGYQFVIKNRFTIDLVIIGPSLANYQLKSTLEGDFDVTEEEILENEILAALTARFPGLKDLLTDKNLDLRGDNAAWSAGFRYQLNIGYRFGKRKI
jgi:hypothetical protein